MCAIECMCMQWPEGGIRSIGSGAQAGASCSLWVLGTQFQASAVHLSSLFLFFIILRLFISVCICLCALSFHHVDPRNLMQVSGLDSKCLYPLSHLTGWIADLMEHLKKYPNVFQHLTDEN